MTVFYWTILKFPSGEWSKWELTCARHVWEIARASLNFGVIDSLDLIEGTSRFGAKAYLLDGTAAPHDCVTCSRRA